MILSDFLLEFSRVEIVGDSPPTSCSPHFLFDFLFDFLVLVTDVKPSMKTILHNTPEKIINLHFFVWF